MTQENAHIDDKPTERDFYDFGKEKGYDEEQYRRDLNILQMETDPEDALSYLDDIWKKKVASRIRVYRYMLRGKNEETPTT